MNKYNPAIDSNPERSPNYSYGDVVPEVEEIQCQEEQFLSCKEWMNREELLKHYKEFHAEYGATDNDAIEVFFEVERSRRYGR